MSDKLTRAQMDGRLESLRRTNGSPDIALLDWYLALDAAARTAFDALAGIHAKSVGWEPNGEKGRALAQIEAIARAALPEGWGKWVVR
jgi:hypothetical protein